MSLYYNKTRRVTVQRRRGRGRYDRATIDAILDEGFVGHVGVVSGDQPFVIPVIYARAGSRVYMHGSPLSRLLGSLANGAAACLTVTLLDGLVLARSAFHHSINYRSVVVLGEAREISDPDEKQKALEAIVEHAVPGRSQDARAPSEQELAATEVVALAIHEASAKIRTGPPIDAAADRRLPVWAGQLPLAEAIGEPVPDRYCTVPVPSYVSGYARIHA